MIGPVTPHDNRPKDFFVGSYRGMRRETVGFDSFELAKKHARLNSPAFVYRADQVTNVHNGVCHLFARDRAPVFSTSDEWRSK